MDRSDEIRDDDYYEHADEGRVDRPRDRDEDARDERKPAGDVLGIADANPPRDHVPSRDDSVGLTESETGRPGSREVQRSPGATSIDMGAGGTGTDIERP
jgi:hypothetical protein